MSRNEPPDSPEASPSGQDAAPGREEIDALWQRIREGDDRAARLLIEHLLETGDEQSLRAAHRAISRHFQRQAQRLVRRAVLAGDSSRRALMDEAIQAYTRGLVAEHLPRLTLDALGGTPAAGVDLPGVLPPPTNLQATGVDRGVDLTWTPSTGAALGQVVSVSDGVNRLLDASLAPTVGSYPVRGLENGKSYLFVVEAVANLLTSPASITATAGVVKTVLLAAVDPRAVGKDRGIDLSWTTPGGLPVGTSITRYLVRLTGEGVEQSAEVPAQPAGVTQSHTFGGLQNGLPYRLSIQSIGTINGVVDQLGETISLDGVAGLMGTVFVPRLPQLPTDPLLFLDTSLVPEILQAERLLAQANAIGQKWRFEYLRERAARAAEESLAYDRQIMELMSMTLVKGTGAGGMVTPVVLSVFDQLQGDVQQISSVVNSVPVAEAIGEVSDAVASALVMAAVLKWLATTNALEMWLGFFDALLGDICAFDTSLSRVKDFFDDQYLNGPFGRAVRELTEQEAGRLSAEISHLVGPLRDAVAAIVGGASKSMGAVFEAFDLPLLMRNTPDGDIPNVNPLLRDLQALEGAVAQLETDLQQRVRETLQQVVEGKAKGLFRALMIAYFVTPLLVALAVALLGGPLAAAILAAVIAIAAQQLLHLVLGWVLGPLTDTLGQLNERVRDAMANLQRAISYQVPPGALSDPTSRLALLRDELRELRDLLPQAFLEDLAELLADVRDITLGGGITQALGAERALGFDNATAFDRILYAYRSRFTPAVQMPGGTDAGLFAGAGLLRDLALLEQDLVRVTDGKEVEVTRRLSLFQLLGGTGDPLTATGLALGRFTDFLRTGQASVELRPEALLDGPTPGVYRAIIQEVGVFAVAKPAAAGGVLAATGLAVTLTHDGESRTRIRRDSNPASPPIDLPLGYPDRTAYVLAATYRRDLVKTALPLSPNSVEGQVWAIINEIDENVSWTAIRKACLDQLPAAVSGLANVVTTGRAGATASSALAGHGADRAIDDDRQTYYSSKDYTSAEPPPEDPAWLAVELSQPSGVITGVRLWPRPGGLGFPAAFRLQVSQTGAADDYRDVPSFSSAVVSTPGREAYYYHFAPIHGQYVRIFATRLGAGAAPNVFNLQLSDVQVEVMNGTFTTLALQTATSDPQYTDPAHPASRLINGDLTAANFYSSTSYMQPDPGAAAPWFEVGFQSPQLVNRLRLYPRQGQQQDFPSRFSFQLQGTHTYEYSYQDYRIGGADPQDFYFPTQSLRAIRFRATLLPQVAPYEFALQLAQAEAAGFTAAPHLVNPAPLSTAVEAILRTMPWPPPVPLEPVEASIAIAAALVDGVSASGVPGLGATAGSAWDAARAELLGHIAKWGGASQEEDPDPNVRGMGFVDLVQRVAPEAATFDLFPVEGAAPGSGVYLRPRADGASGEGGQHRPFENLGIGGRVRVDAPQAAVSGLADLLIEVTMRGCYDPDLAAAVRAGQQQRDAQITRAVDVGAGVGRVLTLGEPVVSLATGGLRTVQFSLRNQRDRVLQAALAGAQVLKGTTAPISQPVSVDGIEFTPSQVAALGSTDAFSFFGSQALPTSVTLGFPQQAGLSLQDQLTQIAVTPETLGVDLGLLNGGLLPFGSQPAPVLEGIAVTLLPMRHAVSTLAPTVAEIDPKLQPLLGWTQGQAITTRLHMTLPEQARTGAVGLADLWSAGGGGRRLKIDFGNAIAGGDLYDLVFSLSFRIPLLEGVTTAPDLF